MASGSSGGSSGAGGFVGYPDRAEDHFNGTAPTSSSPADGDSAWIENDTGYAILVCLKSQRSSSTAALAVIDVSDDGGATTLFSVGSEAKFSTANTLTESAFCCVPAGYHYKTKTGSSGTLTSVSELVVVPLA